MKLCSKSGMLQYKFKQQGIKTARDGYFPCGVGSGDRSKYWLGQATFMSPFQKLLQVQFRSGRMGIFVTAGDLEKFGKLAGNNRMMVAPLLAAPQRIRDVVAHHDVGFLG
jgi:hypothetical protein